MITTEGRDGYYNVYFVFAYDRLIGSVTIRVVTMNLIYRLIMNRLHHHQLTLSFDLNFGRFWRDPDLERL